MWTYVLVIFGILAAALSTQNCCDALSVHEGGTAVVSCLIPTSARPESPVYWYSFKFSEYLTEDYQVTLKTNLTVNLINRLSVHGGGRIYNLQITNITVAEAGEYSCGYYTSSGRWVTVSTNNIMVHGPIAPDPVYPLCATDPSDQLYPGQTIRLVCISRGGVPPATLSWYREGVPLQTTQSDSQFEGYYERTLLALDNGVEFVCKATSPGVDTPKSCSVTPLRLIPHVRIYASQDPVQIGQKEVQFNCVGEGVPSISSYFWYWNGQLITGLTQDPERLVIGGDNGQILTLMTPQLSDNNMLILCVIETSTRLRNTDHIRLVVRKRGSSSNSSSGNTGKPLTTKPVAEPVNDKNSRCSSLSTGAAFGCIFAGMVISIVIYGIVKGTLRFRDRHHGNMEFNKIALSDLNNYRRPCNVGGSGGSRSAVTTAEDLSRMNQTNNKTCNLGVIDLVTSTNDTDYDHIQDNDTRHTSVHSDGKQMEQIYANPNNSAQTDANIDEERCWAQAGPNKNKEVNKSSHGSEPRRLSDDEYDLPKTKGASSSSCGYSPQRERSHSVAAQAQPVKQYQKPRRSGMPKIQEDSNSASLSNMTNMAISLPDLSPLSTSRTVLVPLDLDTPLNHDYVNMGVTSPERATRTSVPEYVNYRGRRDRDRRSDSSSSGYCEEPDSPNSVLLSPSKKPLSYAELDFSDSFERNASSCENLDVDEQTCSIPGPATCDLTSYARIAYVFKDRRQQSEPY